VIVIDANDFSSQIVGRLPLSGSITNAIDVAARRMYFQQSNALWYLDMVAMTYHKLGTLPGRWPRMEYNPDDGMLYMGTYETLYIVDPELSLVLSTYAIEGMESPVGGGDLKFGPDGVLYMCAFSGLYRLGDILESGPVQATRLSAEDLAYNPTSLTVGADGTLYFGENSSDSRLFGMSPVNGDYQELAHYQHKINDLTTLPRDEASLDEEDTDGDGIPNHADDFPEDGERAFQTYTPSEFGYGSLAFEDLWPAKGDYDFNDLVLNYRMIKVANAANEIVEVQATFKITAIGAAYHNGFGLQLPVAPERVESVTGTNLTTDLIDVLDNGVEAGQDQAVIILFDRARDNVVAYRSPYPAVEGRELQLTIRFTEPVPAAELGAAPFNPFLIVNGNRGREVHLQNQAPTSLAVSEYFDSQDDDSGSGTYYSASAGHPWAIHIIHEFRFPRERISIEDAYNYFLAWATTDGESHPDWYKDNAGYRVIEKLVL
jgi:LruC domain-containing protein